MLPYSELESKLDRLLGDTVQGILSGGYCPGGYCPRTSRQSSSQIMFYCVDFQLQLYSYREVSCPAIINFYHLTLSKLTFADHTL